jgi:hypothetical protein
MEAKEVSKKDPQESKVEKRDLFWVKYVVLLILFSVSIWIFSLIMSNIAYYRNNISQDNYYSTSRIYGGPLEQKSPMLNAVEDTSYLASERNLSKQQIVEYVRNTFIVSTDANVTINAEFVKKGLALQPTYSTDFTAKYVLRNTLDEESIITFDFPFPISSEDNEISNAKLVIDGVEISNAKGKVRTLTSTVDGLKWQGAIKPKSDLIVEVSYSTVGLSYFTYEGIENPGGSQDFKFAATINGTRLYNIDRGLSVDTREFGDKTVTLTWDKPSLYSRPSVSISVGESINPSEQVSRIYLTMAPVYFIFMGVLLYLSYRFSKLLSIFDMLLITVLFTIYFPFIHYLSSFTIDPTIEVFSFMKNAIYFSMPLYGAFSLAAFIVGGLMYYLIGRIAGFSFVTRLGLPSMLLFMGFFPVAVTVPEYSMLMVILGLIAFITIVIQVRVRMIQK